MDQINWADPKSKISKYFTVKEAIWLNEWNRLADAADGLTDQVKESIVHVALTLMDPLREKIGQALFIKSWYRPKAYNLLIGGAGLSCHMYLTKNVGAVDWWLDYNGDGEKTGADCDQLKVLLKPWMESMGFRVEDNGAGARWIHTDNKPVPLGGNYFFKP